MSSTAYPDYTIPDEFPEGQALVFGGSGGLGGAVAQAFAARGVPVVVSFNRGERRAAELVEAIKKNGGHASAAHAAVSASSSVAAFFETAARNGPIHTVIFASGPHTYLEPIAKSDPERLRQYVETDVMGFKHVAQASIPHLRQCCGSITALVKCAVRGWLPHDVLSIVPKAGVWALVQGIAREEGPKGVRANAIGAGVIDAGMTERERATVSSTSASSKASAVWRRFGASGSARRPPRLRRSWPRAAPPTSPASCSMWTAAWATRSARKEPMQTYYLHLASRGLPGQDEVYSRWYLEVHVPEVLTVEGFRRLVARYRVVNDDPQPVYLAIWEIESDDPHATLAGLFARSGDMTLSPALDPEFLQTAVYAPAL